MKRIYLLPLLLLVLILSVSAAADEQISFTESEISIFENDQYFLMPSLSDGLTGGEVTYKSGDNRIATVNANGQVTGVSKGRVTITATLKTAKQTYRATVKVTVLRAVQEIEVNEDSLNVLTAADGFSFVLAQNLLSDALPEEQYETGMALEKIILLAKGKTLNIRPTVKPNNASDKSVEILSSDPEKLVVRKQALSGDTAGASILTVQRLQSRGQSGIRRSGGRSRHEAQCGYRPRHHRRGRHDAAGGHVRTRGRDLPRRGMGQRKPEDRFGG